MQLFTKPMTEERAANILNWKYEQPYDFYNNEATDEALQEMLDGSYYAVVDSQNALIGFFCIGGNAQVPIGHQFGVYKEIFVDMGLGMNPTLVAKGNGFDFCTHVIRFIQTQHKNTLIRLTVATFNQRAIRLYEKLGYISGNRFSTDSAEFKTMIKN